MIKIVRLLFGVFTIIGFVACQSSPKVASSDRLPSSEVNPVDALVNQCRPSVVGEGGNKLGAQVGIVAVNGALLLVALKVIAGGVVGGGTSAGRAFETSDIASGSTTASMVAIFAAVGSFLYLGDYDEDGLRGLATEVIYQTPGVYTQQLVDMCERRHAELAERQKVPLIACANIPRELAAKFASAHPCQTEAEVKRLINSFNIKGE